MKALPRLTAITAAAVVLLAGAITPATAAALDATAFTRALDTALTRYAADQADLTVRTSARTVDGTTSIAVNPDGTLTAARRGSQAAQVRCTLDGCWENTGTGWQALAAGAVTISSDITVLGSVPGHGHGHVVGQAFTYTGHIGRVPTSYAAAIASHDLTVMTGTPDRTVTRTTISSTAPATVTAPVLPVGRSTAHWVIGLYTGTLTRR